MHGIVLNGITDARLAGKYAISSTLLKSKSSRGGSLRGLRSSEDSATVSRITSPVGEMERVRITLQTVTTACWCLVLVARISDHQGVYGLFFSSLLILEWKKGIEPMIHEKKLVTLDERLFLKKVLKNQ